MSERSGRRSALGLVVIALGLLFLAGNLGWLQVSPAAIWPLFIVWFGLAVGRRLFRCFSWVRLTAAGMLVLFGAMLALNNAGYVFPWDGGLSRPGDVFRLGWPLFLIAWGLDWLTGRRGSFWRFGCGWRDCGDRSGWRERRRWARWARRARWADLVNPGPRTAPGASAPPGTSAGSADAADPADTASAGGDESSQWSPDWEDHSQMFGDLRFGRGWTLRNATISLMFGDLDIDLGQARVEPGSYQLEVSLVAGDVDIYVPADVEVKVEAEARAGRLRAFSEERSGVNPALTYESPGYATAAKRVYIRAQLVAGDFSVARAG